MLEQTPPSRLVNIKSNLINVKFNAVKKYNTDPNVKAKLEDFQTKFTSLPYALDRPQGGYSGLPYIKTYQPQVPYASNATGPGFPIFKVGTTGNLDYPIRGGGAEIQLGSINFNVASTISSRIDRLRIQKFFNDKPRGEAFIQKQIGLQLSNPKIETGNIVYDFSRDLVGNRQATLIPGFLENTRVYNAGRNTLSSVLSSGTGNRVVRHGNVPYAIGQKNYYSTVNEQNVLGDLSGSIQNRLLILRNLKMKTLPASDNERVNPENVLDMNLVYNLGISLNRNILFQYLGGPGSVYGIGNTTIQRFTDTTKLGVSVFKAASRNAMVYNQLINQSVNSGVKRVYNIQDYAVELEKSRPKTAIDTIRENYQSRIDRIIERSNGAPDERDANRIKKLQEKIDGLPKEEKSSITTWESNQSTDARFYTNYRRDTLNSKLPYILSDNTQSPFQDENNWNDDLIKFCFEAINNNNPTESLVLQFRAFLMSGLTDNNNAIWNSFKYLGRGEDFYTYQGFNRSVSFSFRVAAQSEAELLPMYNRINALISQVYPDYSPNSGIMRGPLMRLTVGDYFYRMPGFLESISITVPQDSSWEIKDGSQLPFYFEVQISYKPIMESLPKRANYTIQSSDTNQGESVNSIPEFIGNNGKIIKQNLEKNSKPFTGPIVEA